MQIQWNEQSVGEVVAQNMHAARIFETHGIDFCCGGKKTLPEACQEKKVDTEALKADLEALPEKGGHDVSSWSTEFLIDYIINTHHQYVRTMLPTIMAHAAKVASVHGDTHPEVRDIAGVFQQVQMELESHMMKEERILFPYIRQLAAAEREEGPVFSSGFGSVQNPIDMMEQEHDSVGLAFDHMRTLANDFTPPAEACTTYQLFYRELDEFERDLHLHIHLENNVLHPRALAMEERLTQTA
ncbi:MAG: iron-sulfur cluster repair di-iron protein [Bacteroidetes bacterium]|nr:iron-sulfur cluster repair di-iron protein [Bacteroidota bacterium]